MAGDLPVKERAILGGGIQAFALEPRAAAREQAIHNYGRLSILARPEAVEGAPAADARALWNALDGMTEVERLGLAAFWLRESAAYQFAKHRRPRAGEEWNMERCTTAVPAPTVGARSVGARSGGPTSSYLEGSVAVGIPL